MQARVITDSNPQIKDNFQAQVQELPYIAQVQEVLNPKLTYDNRSDFYTGEDRLTLQISQIQRVRDLQETNDNLQREIRMKEKMLSNSSDPLSVLADMEHCNIMIARNTGEILKIHTQNEARLRRIAELEEQNIRLEKEMVIMQGKFITTHDMQQRTKYAAEFFLTKASMEKNIAELAELNQL